MRTLPKPKDEKQKNIQPEKKDKNSSKENEKIDKIKDPKPEKGSEGL